MSQGGVFKPKHEVVDITDSKFTLIVDKELQAQIAYLHNKHEGVEWCGMLFYDIETGDLTDLENMVVRAKRLYLIDVGNAGYTGGDLDEKLLDFYDEYPDAMDMRMGFIHTHHSMQTFFSGTDMQELHDNTEKYNFYLSLIVNHKSQYCAKISTVGHSLSDSTFTFPGDDPRVPIIKKSRKESTIMVTYNADIQFDVNEYFKDRYEEVSPKSKFPPFKGYSTGQSSGYSGYSRSAFEEDDDDLPLRRWNSEGNSSNQTTLGFQSSASREASAIKNEKIGNMTEQESLIEDDNTLESLTDEEVLMLFDIKTDQYNRQTVLKKVYNLDVQMIDPRVVSTVIDERISAFDKADFDLKTGMTLNIPEILRKSLIKVYELSTYEGAVQDRILEALSQEVQKTFDVFVGKDKKHLFHAAVYDALLELEYVNNTKVTMN